MSSKKIESFIAHWITRHKQEEIRYAEANGRETTRMMYYYRDLERYFRNIVAQQEGPLYEGDLVQCYEEAEQKAIGRKYPATFEYVGKVYSSIC